jgi:hypothetical protein
MKMARKSTNELIALVSAESTRKYDPINKVNPATSVIYMDGKDQPTKSKEGFFKSKTEAEYGGIIYLLEQALESGNKATIRIDDITLAKQICGDYKVTKPSLVQARQQVWDLMKKLGDKVHVYFHVDVQPKEKEVVSATDAFGQ